MSTPPPDGIRLWRLSVAALALALAPWGASAQRVVYDGPGVTVPADFGCWHDVGYVVNWPKLGGQDLYHGPDPAFRVRANRVRLYGMGGLEWNVTEKSPGVFDWARWDEAFGKLRATAVGHVTLNLYNPPSFATRFKHDYGGWRMQLPRDRAMFGRTDRRAVHDPRIGRNAALHFQRQRIVLRLSPHQTQINARALRRVGDLQFAGL